jgi:hypothetical protein
MPQTVTAEVFTAITRDVIDGSRAAAAGFWSSTEPVFWRTSMTSTTSTPAALADRYFAMWNTGDADARAEIIASTWVDEGVFVDPSFEVSGHEGLTKMVETAHQLFPGYRFTRTGDIDEHHDRLRWSWELAADGQAPVAGGTDVVTLHANGKIIEVIGFLNFAPAH